MLVCVDLISNLCNILCNIVIFLLLISIFPLCLFNRDNKNENQDDSIWLKEKWSIGEVWNTFLWSMLIVLFLH